MSSSELQVQLDVMSTIISSDFGKIVAYVGIVSVVCLFLLMYFIDFFDSLSRYHRNRRAANHCDDLHKGVKQGHCHYKGCIFRAGCPYYEKLTLRKRWQQFRAKKNSTPG